MWYEDLGKTVFLEVLYNQIPDLVNVRIKQIFLFDDGEKAVIIFDMPDFIDNIPPDWMNLGYNSLCIEIIFGSIKNFRLLYDGGLLMIGDIDIIKNKEGFFVKIEGDVNCQFQAKNAMIQKITGYTLDCAGEYGRV